MRFTAPTQQSTVGQPRGWKRTPSGPGQCGCSQGSESLREPVRRLVVAHGLEIAGHRRGAGVEKRPLHAVAPIAVAQDSIHPRTGQQHGRHVAGLCLAKRASARRILLARGHAIGQHVILVQPRQRTERGLKMTPVARPGINQGRQADVFVKDDHVPRQQAAFTPRLEIFGDRGLGDGRQRAIENASVAAVGIGLEHRVQIAQAAHVEEMRRPHFHGVIGIHFDQGVEHPLVAGALVERHQRAAHLRMRPAVEALRLVALFPIDERRAELGLIDAGDDGVEPGAGSCESRLDRAGQSPGASRRRANRRTVRGASRLRPQSRRGR